MRIETRQAIHHLSRNSSCQTCDQNQVHVSDLDRHDHDDLNQIQIHDHHHDVGQNKVSARTPIPDTNLKQQCTITDGHHNYDLVNGSDVPATESKLTRDTLQNVCLDELKNAVNSVGNGTSMEDHDIAHLKDLLILNLDLIQHQQQLLISRERQIKNLIMEKDALKSHLERIDRRMSLLKQKGITTAEEMDHINCATSTCDSGDVERPMTLEKMNKRKSTTKHAMSRKQARITAGTPRVSASSVNVDIPPDHVQHPIEKHEPKRGVQYPSMKESVELFRTESEFFIPVEEYHDPEIVGKMMKSPRRKNKIKVEVPKWRFHPVSNCYQMEGTEITDDEIYLKRHSKLENEEKRRKRWDTQRLREQTAYQKLVSCRIGRSERLEEPKPVLSFWPDSEEIRQIEVRESLPVNVFGYPLPKIRARNFTLRWQSMFAVKDTKIRPRRR